MSSPASNAASKPVRPIVRFASAVAKCTPEATNYGKCIAVDYNNVYKDKCAKEFAVLKDCYLVSATYVIEVEKREREELWAD